MSGLAFIDCGGSWVNATRIISFREGPEAKDPTVVVYDTWGQAHWFQGRIDEFVEKLERAQGALA